VLFTLGLVKKVLIADPVAPWAAAAFDGPGVPGCADAWVGALAYTMQLYFDYSGYSDMAIGLGLIFNVRLPDNFAAPYRAASIVQFWQRWHMTLSRFLRDYLYIPLGGNRRGEGRRYANLMVTMFLGGLWHGAGWTFAAWGTYHGALLVAAHRWRAAGGRPVPAWLGRPATFLAVVVGWVLFRSATLARAGAMLRAMADPFHTSAAGPPPAMVDRLTRLGWLLVLLAFVNVAPTSRQWLESRPLTRRHAVVLALALFACLLVIRDALLTHKPNPFIYFQF
jgi:D-alanyl-lipoteichoic acid acyltransferase DltB (MBOAT superfamily)